jgi:PhnB protein
MKINPFLTFDGNCSEALKYYVQIFGGVEQHVQTYGYHKEHLEEEFGIKVSPEWAEKIQHASFVLPHSGEKIYLRDRAEGETVCDGCGAAYAIEFSCQPDLDRVYDALAAEGKVIVPLKKVFWHAMYAEVVDKYNKKWVLNCQIVSILDN